MADEATTPIPALPPERKHGYPTPIPAFPLKGKESTELRSVRIEGRYQSFAFQDGGWRKGQNRHFVTASLRQRLAVGRHRLAVGPGGLQKVESRKSKVESCCGLLSVGGG